LDQLSLTLVTDRSQTNGRDLVTVISECLAVGLPAVQVREKDLSGKDLAILCRQLRNLTRRKPAPATGCGHAELADEPVRRRDRASRFFL